LSELTKTQYEKVITYYVENNDIETAKNYVRSYADKFKLNQTEEFKKIEKLTQKPKKPEKQEEKINV
jgi:hypothetical protein